MRITERDVPGDGIVVHQKEVHLALDDSHRIAPIVTPHDGANQDGLIFTASPERCLVVEHIAPVTHAIVKTERVTLDMMNGSLLAHPTTILYTHHGIPEELEGKNRPEAYKDHVTFVYYDVDAQAVSPP